VGARDSYPAGTFCWVDLATTDAPAAQRFYAELLGWDAPGVDRYVHWTREGHDVAGVYPREGEPRWTSYVAVADVDATAPRAEALGGSVAEPPFDAGLEGRRALLRDPAGAATAAGGAVRFPPTTVGIGRIAVLQDPQGAAFGVFAGPTDP
jgi:predicted enzyme related to lactoylglutathione lyase